MKAPIVEYITPTAENKEDFTEDDLSDISFLNVVNNASWHQTDILLSTPTVLNYILQKTQKYNPYYVNPSVLVFDEIDLLLSGDKIKKQVL